MSSAQVTAVIIARNEEVHIGRCLERLKPLAERIVVVDSFSTDRTVEIAESSGAEVLQNPFVNHAAQFNWGVDAAAIADGWVLRIDADEWFEPEAIAEIRRLLPTLADDVTALSFRRKVYFQGRWIRWGGYYPTVLTRLWRAGRARVEQRWMDEHVEVLDGRTLLLPKGDLVDENIKDLTDWTDKHNGYATRQMIEVLNQELPLFRREENAGSLNQAAGRRRALRSLYGRFPLFLRALFYFLQRYLLRLGFLDGRPGLVFHTLQGFWWFFLIDAKIDEARRHAATHGVADLRAHLARRHAISLQAPDDD